MTSWHADFFNGLLGEIQVFGIKLDQEQNQDAILWMLLLLTIGFTVSFLVSAWPDFMRFKMARDQRLLGKIPRPSPRSINEIEDRISAAQDAQIKAVTNYLEAFPADPEGAGKAAGNACGAMARFEHALKRV